MDPPTLLAVPNISEGRSDAIVAQIADAFVHGGADSGARGERGVAPAARLLDVHSDADHHRSVFTLAGGPGALADGLLAGARAALEHVEVVSRAAAGPAQAGQHPHVGAVDVVPIVYLHASDRGAACAEALVVADRIGHELQVPVFLYGELTADGERPPRTRAELRRGGVTAVAERLAAEHEPDFGPRRLHPRAGVTLVAARPPLVAFNVQLAAPATLADARAIAAQIREDGAHGLPGLRAIGVQLAGGVAQVSMNVERPLQLPLARVVDAVSEHAQVTSAELVGLAPAAALEGFPAELPMPGFDAARHIIENALGC